MTKYEDNRLSKAYYDGCKDKEKEMLDKFEKMIDECRIYKIFGKGIKMRFIDKEELKQKLQTLRGEK